MYIVGLGNPGEKYTATRHNVGWMVLDTLRSEMSCTDTDHVPHWKALIAKCNGTSELPVTLVYPQTFMNRSGETVRAIMRDDAESAIIIVHDDTALPVGKIRISQGRGTGGHNGIKSIYDQTKKTDFVRVRVGVAGKRWWGSEPYVPTGPALPRHVLSGFSWWERGAMHEGITTATQALQALCTDDVTTVMNMYNGNNPSST